MVDLPDFTPETAVAEAPKQRISGGEIARGGEALAQGASELGEGLENLAEPIARQAGEEAAQNVAITRNPDGSLNVATPRTSFIMGKAGDAYQEAVTQGTLSRLHTQIDSDLSDLARNNRDPRQFQTASASYLQRLNESDNPIDMHAAEYGVGVASQLHSGLLDQKAREDVGTSKDAMQARQKYIEGQMEGLAAQGGIGTDAFNQYAAERAGILNSLVANPLYNYNAEMKKVDDDTFHDELIENRVIGAARAQYSKDQNVAAAVQYIHDQLAPLNLPAEKLSQLEGEATQHLTLLHSANEQAKSELGDAADAFKQLTDATGAVDTARATNLVRQLDAQKMYSKEGEVLGSQSYAKIKSATDWNTPAGSIRSLNDARALVEEKAGAGGFDSAAARTLGFEGSELVTDSNGSAVKYGVNQADHPGINVANLTESQAKGIYKPYWDAIGGDKLSAPLARVAFDTAIMSGPAKANELIKQSGGDPTKFMDLREQFLNGLAQNNPVKYGKYVESWDNRNTELRSDIEKAGEMQPAMAALYTKVQGHLNDVAKAAFANMNEAYSKGQQPTPQEQSDMKGLAGYITDPDLSRQVIEKMAEARGLASYDALPQSQKDDIRDTWSIAAQEGGASSIARKVLGMAQTQADHVANLQKNDPAGAADLALANAPKGTVPQGPTNLDPRDPAQVQQVMNVTRAKIGMANIKDPTAALSPALFSQWQRQLITRMMPAMNGQQAQGLLGALATARPDELTYELSQKEGLKDSIIGFTKSGDPAKINAAYGFMQHLQETNPAAFEASFVKDDEETGKALIKWETASQFLSGDALAKLMIGGGNAEDVAAQKEIYNRTMEKTKKEGGISDVSFADIAGAFKGGLLSGTPDLVTDKSGAAQQVVVNEWKALYADYMSDGGDAAGAAKWANSRLALKWSVSGVNNGNLMAWAPDKEDSSGNGQYFKKVGGSFDWIKGQLDDYMVHASGMYLSTDQSDASPAEYMDNFQGRPRSLVSDKITRDQVANGKPPSYMVVMVGDKGRPEPVMNPEDGTVLRFRPDEKRALAEDAAGRAAANAPVVAGRQAVSAQLKHVLPAAQAQAITQGGG